MALITGEPAVVTDPFPDDVRAKVEAEHGPVVAIGHPDGSVFAFKRLTREQHTVREIRIERGGPEAAEASDKLMQVMAVWPSKEAWNKYVAASVFETAVYFSAYRDQHGGRRATAMVAAELPDDADPALLWLSNGEVQFGFRKPGRAEVKLYQAQILAKHRGERPKADPTETLLKQCGSKEFAAWLEENLFGAESFGNAFAEAFGMTEARVTGN